MNKRIELTEAIIENNKLILHPANSVEIEGLKPQGQLLADSDQLSFVYLLESADEFVYAGLPYTIWSKLKEAKDKGFQIVIKSNEQEIELIQLVEELNDLLENIKGNANYGEEMETKVVELFSL